MPAPDSLSRAALRAMLVWLALSAALFFVGRDVLDASLPFLRTVTEGLSDEYAVVLRWHPEDESKLAAVATFLKLDRDLFGIGIKPGDQVTATTHVEHMLVPLVILWTVLLAWPVGRLKERVALVLAGLPFSLAALALTTPFLLAGKIEIVLQNRALSAQVERANPLLLDWMLFTEGGGRWLLALVLGCLCVGLVRQVLGSNEGEGLPVAAS